MVVQDGLWKEKEKHTHIHTHIRTHRKMYSFVALPGQHDGVSSQCVRSSKSQMAADWLHE